MMTHYHFWISLTDLLNVVAVLHGADRAPTVGGVEVPVCLGPVDWAMF